jgi:hypothetical protein
MGPGTRRRVHAVIETFATTGAYQAVKDRGQFAVGVTNVTDFLRPQRVGRLEVVAEPIQQGRTQQLWQVVITRVQDGKAVARGQVRLQNIDATPSLDPPGGPMPGPPASTHALLATANGDDHPADLTQSY